MYLPFYFPPEILVNPLLIHWSWPSHPHRFLPKLHSKMNPITRWHGPNNSTNSGETAEFSLTCDNCATSETGCAVSAFLLLLLLPTPLRGTRKIAPPKFQQGPGLNVGWSFKTVVNSSKKSWLRNAFTKKRPWLCCFSSDSMCPPSR